MTGADDDERSPRGSTFHGPAFVQTGAQSSQEIHITSVPQPPSWPMRVGAIPALASAFQQRDSVRAAVERVWRRKSGARIQVLTGGGGVGKTQIAASFAHQALQPGHADLVVWVDASQIGRVVARYADAAMRVRAPGQGSGSVEDDARVFLDWLATTDRAWLVVLDDITDPAAVGPWWPPADRGRTLATTRRRDAVLSGGGRVTTEVTGYSADETSAYLTERLGEARQPNLFDYGGQPLGAELGHLPLAVGYAAAYMINESIPCSAYLGRLADNRVRLDEVLPEEADAESYGRRTVTAALLLSVAAVQRARPDAPTLAALQLAALLDPAGHPDALWETAEAAAFLGIAGDRGHDDVRSVMSLLHRYALITWDGTGARAVKMHALTARTVRETLPATAPSEVTLAAADSLVALWEDDEAEEAELLASLRANANVVADHAGDLLLQDSPHRLLALIGNSLLDEGLYGEAARHWERMLDAALRGHTRTEPSVILLRRLGADAWAHAGRHDKAVRAEEKLVADCESDLGSDDEHTLTVRSRLGRRYWELNRMDDALDVEAEVLATCVRLYGDVDPRTLRARHHYAGTIWYLGQPREALHLMKGVVRAYREQLGQDHERTLSASHALANMQAAAGDTKTAIRLLETVAAAYARRDGPDTFDYLRVRGSLAKAYDRAGKTRKYLALLEASAEQAAAMFGPQHPNAVIARHNLAVAHRKAGHRRKAVDLMLQVVEDFELALGTHHPSTYNARANLVEAYVAAGRQEEAAMMQMAISAMLHLRNEALGREDVD